MSELQKKVDFGIKLIQSAAKKAEEAGQVVCISFSGGKDSACILELAKMAGVKYRAIYHNTTIDPPMTIKYCKDNGVDVIQPKRSFLELIKWGGFPNRYYRFCCHYLKEIKMDEHDYVVLGIRADESSKRKARYTEPEQCRVFTKSKKERQYFPILYWSAQDVKDFIKDRGVKLHPLYYDENGDIDANRRLGCLGCPLASKKHRIEEFKQYPKLLNLYARGGGRNTLIITKIANKTSSLVMYMNGLFVNFFVTIILSSKKGSGKIFSAMARTAKNY